MGPPSIDGDLADDRSLKMQDGWLSTEVAFSNTVLQKK